MNMSAWWLYCETEEDKAFYRRHIVKSVQTIDWIREQQGCHYDPHDVEKPPEKEYNTDLLKPLFKNLSKLDRQILTLRYAEQMKWKEIAVKLDYNLSYLWKREKRAMEKLRAIIERDGLSPWRKDEQTDR